MLREILARFGIKFDDRPVTKADTAIGKLKAGLIGLVAAFGAGALVAGIRGFVEEMAQLGDETAKTSRQIGISGRQLQALRFAAERSGVDAGSLTNGIRRLQRNIVDASEGVDTAVRAFKDLGVSVFDAEGRVREIQDILPDIADGFTGLETATQRSARAQQVFGRSGALLLPFFENGSEGIRELTERFDRLGGGMGEDFLANAEAAQDALSDWNLAMLGLKSTIATQLLPGFTRMVNGLAELVADFREAARNTKLWEAVLVTLGIVGAAAAVALVVAFFPIIATAVLIAAAVAALFLIVEDFLNFLEGSPSVTGAVVSAITRAWNDAVEIWSDIFSDAAEAIGGFFTGLWEGLVAGVGAVEAFFTGLWEGIVSGLEGVVARVLRGVRTIADAIDGVAGFFGFDVDLGSRVGGARGAGGDRSVAARGPEVTVRPQAGETRVEQRVDVTINAPPGMTPEDLERRTRRAVEDANRRAFRDADRALVPVAG